MTNPSYSLWALVRYFLYLGATGFGGPIALVAAMERDLVEGKKWFSIEDFRDGLLLAQLCPGPMASQMAIYLGWLRGGWRGAALIGVVFLIPALLMVLLIAHFYILLGSLRWMQGIFLGVSPLVLVLMGKASLRLSRKTLERDYLLWVIAILNCVLVVVLRQELFSVFVFSGLGCVFVKYFHRANAGAKVTGFLPIGLVTGLHGPATDETLQKLFLFFLKAGSVVFGTGLVIVPFLRGGVVNEYHWLSEQQFLDAVAVAMITPGPVVITVAFIGFLVAGFIGAGLAVFGAFFPCYLFTVIPAPFFQKIKNISWLRDLVHGVTAAAVGALAGAVILIAFTTLDSPLKWILCAIALAWQWFFPKLPDAFAIFLFGFAGFFLFTLSY